MDTYINVSQVSTGFIEIPNKISINIYAQGCKKRCEGCHNKESQNFDGGYKLYLSDIEKIKQDHFLSNWICWLGGDAVYQPEKFQIFNSHFSTLGFKMCLYTGLNRDEFNVQDPLFYYLSTIVYGEWKGIPVHRKDSNQKILVRHGYDWKELNWDQWNELLKGDNNV